MSFLGFDCDGNKIPEEHVRNLFHKKVVHESTFFFMINDYEVKVKLEIHRTCAVLAAFYYDDKQYMWRFDPWKGHDSFHRMMTMYNEAHNIDPPLSTDPPKTLDEQNAAIAAIKCSVVEAFGLLSKACKDFPGGVFEHCCNVCRLINPLNYDCYDYDPDDWCLIYMYELWDFLRENILKTQFTTTRVLSDELVVGDLISDFKVIRGQ